MKPHLEIILIRHGKPIAATNPKLSVKEFSRWIREYNRSEIAADSFPPDRLKTELNDHYVISSDLRRAVHSAEMCVSNEPALILRQIREFDIPRYKVPFVLSANHWLLLSRLLWLLGVTSKVESYKEAQSRAMQSAISIIDIAKAHQRVAVFGHGLMNRALAKQLERQGWRCTEKSGNYWGITKMVLQ